jgi:hypothetical protein
VKGERAKAIQEGRTTYFTGKPCKHGHVCERIVPGGNCIECKKLSTNIWESRNREVMRKRTRAWAKANPDKIKGYKAKYRSKTLVTTRIRRGLPVPTRAVPSVCEICGEPEKGKALALDHCHKQGIFRGWLCTQCNLGLSMFKDNPVAFLTAFRYLAQSQMPHIELVELTPEQAARRGLQ